MHVETVSYRAKGAPAKAFAWSYSKLKNYETCPKRHFHVDIKKDFKEAESEQLLWGNRVHKMLAQRIASGSELPPVHKPDLEPWAERVLDGPGKILVEQQLAITKDFSPCAWFSKDAWYRAIADVIKVHGPVGIVIDWKTGKIVEDSVQLMLTAACMFYHYPTLKVIRSKFVWLKEDAETVATIQRDELPKLWSNLWDRIECLREAYETTDFPPTPNRLCKNWCPVKTCKFNGEAHG